MTNTYAATGLDPLENTVPDAVTVSLMTSGATADRRLAGGVLAHIGRRSGIRPVVGLAPWVDVLLVLASPLTGEVLAEMTAAADHAENPEQCMVLVTGLILPRQLAQVAACGAVSVLPAHPGTPERIVEALLASASASADAPVLLPPRPRPVPPGEDLTARESEVLRLLADGHATNEIAERLHYSERTIKKDLHELMSRMHLRNRTHAVAHALRAGAI